MEKFCSHSSLRVDIKELSKGGDWKNGTVEFYPCWKKCHFPIYTIPVSRLLTENFWDLCQEAWHAPIPELYDKRTDSSCERDLCDWTGTELYGVEVNFSYACNLNCVFCTYTHKYDKELEDLYFKCLEEIKNHDVMIGFTTTGEPFFNKARMFQFLKTLNNKRVNISTNATLLNKDDANEIVRLFREQNIKFQLNLSINGISEETLFQVEHARVNIQNLREIIKILSDGLYYFGNISFVAIPQNLHELPKLKEFFGSIAPVLIDELHVMTNLNIGSTDAKEVLQSKEWKDFFNNEEATMWNKPIEVEL